MSGPHRDASVSVHVVRRDGAATRRDRDSLTAEEPLEIRLREGDGPAARFVVTMRTPGDDDDLVVGLLFGEGVISGIADVASVGPSDEPGLAPELARNVRVATLAAGARPGWPRRATVMGSACGVCGRTSISDVLALAASARARSNGPPDARGTADFAIPAALLTSLPAVLRARQSVFAATGGLHAAGFFEADGTLAVAREDVGRHNATDKAVGALLRERRPTPPILLVSGRLGFEIAQKAALAGARIVAAVSAPTSLAVELAEEAGLTIVGFLRGERFNVYAHPGRIRE
jgi:FdhD protein